MIVKALISPPNIMVSAATKSVIPSTPLGIDGAAGGFGGEAQTAGAGRHGRPP